MKLTGQKTPAVFRRYNIVSDGNLREAAGVYGPYAGGCDRSALRRDKKHEDRFIGKHWLIRWHQALELL